MNNSSKETIINLAIAAGTNDPTGNVILMDGKPIFPTELQGTTVFYKDKEGDSYVSQIGKHTFEYGSKHNV